MAIRMYVPLRGTVGLLEGSLATVLKAYFPRGGDPTYRTSSLPSSRLQPVFSPDGGIFSWEVPFVTSPNNGTSRPELVIGLVGPLGTDLDTVVASLTSSLTGAGYETEEIKLSRLMGALYGLDTNLNSHDEQARYETHMDAGDELRRKIGDDALVRLAVSRLRERRRFAERDYPETVHPHLLVQFHSSVEPDTIRSVQGFEEFVGAEEELEARFRLDHDLNTAMNNVVDLPINNIQLDPPPLDPSNEPIPSRAWVLRSLKHPGEVDLLRRVYGSRFLLFGVTSPKSDRAEDLSAKIAKSKANFEGRRFLSEAYGLIRRDEDDRAKEHGQKTRRVFWKSDFFLGVQMGFSSLGEQIDRIVQLLFGAPFVTPSRQEAGMMSAAAASRRSSSMARQVGAAITRKDGRVIATGCNDSPKPFGGLYWEGDTPDHRDFQHGTDISDDLKGRLLWDLVRRLHSYGWLPNDKASTYEEDPASITEEFEHSVLGTPLVDDVQSDSGEAKSRLLGLIEFTSSVHAEMEALLAAARDQTSVEDATLYTTTFPCHECTRHIIAAGISEVVFVEPYPKSLALELNGYAVSMEEPSTDRVQYLPFVGVGPTKFLQLFDAPTRKDEAGNAREVDPKENDPRVAAGDLDPRFSIEKEQNVVSELAELMASEGLTWEA